ncbi:hypothetical protein BN940_10636 [Castellaniella defragrans 65Phen]|uniref:Uncharacterized protein n=1 Tax=Castellaniella defragrans (strain DSM 12143 / CCUG 39792 / 65Phen) TaxID=1437824 RepID=W8X437_CASD6|nr:hypothetical protein BN940_10636 [Castellaniella defragrans 65Phen]
MRGGEVGDRHSSDGGKDVIFKIPPYLAGVPRTPLRVGGQPGARDRFKRRRCGRLVMRAWICSHRGCMPWRIRSRTRSRSRRA